MVTPQLDRSSLKLQFTRSGQAITGEGLKRVLALLNIALPANAIRGLVSIGFDEIEGVARAINAVVQNGDLVLSDREHLLDLRVGEPPAEAGFAYVWNEALGGLVRGNSSTSFIGDGWARTGTILWRVPGYESSLEPWLELIVISGSDLLTFLGQILPQMQASGVPVACSLSFNPKPYCSFSILEVSADHLAIDAQWDVSTPALDITGLPGHVLCRNELRPGASSVALAGLPLVHGRNLLKGEDIPRFITHVDRLAGFIQGDHSALGSTHRILRGPAELSLMVSVDRSKVVGSISLQPHLTCQGISNDGKQLSRSMASGAAFHRTGQYWLPVATARKAGLKSDGTLERGDSIASRKLTPAQLITLLPFNVPVSGLKVHVAPSINLPGSGSQVSGLDHLSSLVDCGLPGGLIGRLDETQAVIYALLRKLTESYPKARFALVGSSKTLKSLPLHMSELASTRITTAKDTRNIGQQPGLWLTAVNCLPDIHAALVTFDIAFVLELDELARSTGSQRYDNLCGLRSKLVLAHFYSPAFLQSEYQLAAALGVLRLKGLKTHLVSSTANLLRKVVIAPAASASASPIASTQASPSSAHAPRPSLTPKQPQLEKGYTPPKPAEIVIESATGAITAQPIPAATERPSKQASSSSTATFASRIEFELGSTSFTAKAKGLAQLDQPEAEFVPFFCYWPTYEDLLSQQRAWYFYWRAQARLGQYLPTDLSYIFLHTYELINLVGPSDAADGAQQLRKLWLAYRDCFPKLDGYLVGWQADYQAVYGLGNPLDVYKEASQLGAYVDTDLAISTFAASGLAQMPINLLEKLMDYRPSQSKFWRDGNSGELEEAIRRVLKAADAFFAGNDAEQRGLLRLSGDTHAVELRRKPFQSAPYEGTVEEVLIGEVVRYSLNNQLRAKLTALIKHTENSLRELKDYRGRLRGYELSDDLAQLVARTLQRQPQRRALTIDADRLRALAQESDAVREMLQSRSVDPDATLSAVEKPLHTDVAEVRRIVTSLGTRHRALLLGMSQAQWSTVSMDLKDSEARSIANEINRAARRELGNDLLSFREEHCYIEEDYLDEMAHVLEEGLLTEPEHTPEADELEPRWLEFGKRLSGFQLKTLMTISTRELDLVEIAREQNMMPGMLVEEINRIADEVLGDLLIDDSAELLEIYDYYVDDLQLLLQSAQQPGIIER